MVAKQEVRDWPGVGPLARRAGTIFVHRERLSLLPQTIAAISGALRGGAVVGAFPEATTWCGMAAGRFRPAVFEAAVRTGTPVRPVALRYRLDGTGTTTVAAFVGSVTLWQAVLHLSRVRGLLVEVGLLPLLPATDAAGGAGPDRHELAAEADAAVAAATVPLVPDPEKSAPVVPPSGVPPSAGQQPVVRPGVTTSLRG